MERPSGCGRSARRSGSRRRSEDGSREPGVRLLDDTRTEREGFDVGESVFMAADGLRPVTVHEVVLRDGEKRLPVLAALITDRHSSIPPTVLLPYLGLTSEGEGDAYRGRSHVEGEKALGGRSFVVSVRLTDGSGNIRAIRTGAFSSIPYPYERGVTQLIKSAMKTVRIPLASYTVANAGAQIVDLTNVQSIAFGFLSRPTGEVEVDDTELVP